MYDNIILARIKKLGEPYHCIQFKTNEKLSNLLKNFKIEILDLNFKMFPELIIYVVNKNKEDIFQIRLNPFLKDSFKNAFSKIYDFLNEPKLLEDSTEKGEKHE